MSNSSHGLGKYSAEVGESSSPGLSYSLPEECSDEDRSSVSLITDNGFLGPDQSENRLSFKRKHKLSLGSGLTNLLSSPSQSNSRQASPSPRILGARTRRLSDGSPGVTNNAILPESNAPLPGDARLNDLKDGAALDWYVEGPGRRVGYDDLTAIDWIFEYTKERQRLRALCSRAKGLVGQFQQLADASQIWLVLIATGLVVGILAACIDVASDWLGDLKTGYCQSGSGGGKFYLNKGFCCWGHEEWAQCQDWTPWGQALRIRSEAGKYISEYLLFILFSVFFAVCASVLVQRYALYARHSGIPEIKTVLGGFVIRRFMGMWTLVIKSIGLVVCLAVASGLWLGKEGPLVHVACCCANLLMKMFDALTNNEARKREVLSAAAAAGISVAFGSPIGGVLFSLEQLSYYFPDKTMWQSFVCAMVAAVTLQAFNPFRTGKLVLYQVTYTSGWHGFEMVAFATLGVLGGLYGGIFIKLNMKIAQWRRSPRIAKNPVMEVAVVAMLTALINFPNIFMRAQSSELVYTLFAECAAIPDDQFGLCKTGSATAGVIVLLVLAACLGFIFASVTFGLQVPAGIILPSMAIGALYGRALGIIVEVWQKNYPNALVFAACEPDIPCITPGTYAIIGAASALGGVTRMTVSIVVIMFELTGALTYVLPIMIAVMISKWIGDAFGKRGIYESWIHFNQYPFLDNHDDSPLPDVSVAQIMTAYKDLVVLTATGHTLESVHNLLTSQPYRGFPVVSDRHHAVLLGYISRTELAFALSSAASDGRNFAPTTQIHFSHQPQADPLSALDLRPWMDQTPITLNSKSSLQLTVSLFQKLGLRYVLFCEKGVLQGLLTKEDVWYVLNAPKDVQHSIGIGVTREDGRGEERALLSSDGDTEPIPSPVDER